MYFYCVILANEICPRRPYHANSTLSYQTFYISIIPIPVLTNVQIQLLSTHFQGLGQLTTSTILNFYERNDSEEQEPLNEVRHKNTHTQVTFAYTLKIECPDLNDDYSFISYIPSISTITLPSCHSKLISTGSTRGFHEAHPSTTTLDVERNLQIPRTFRFAIWLPYISSISTVTLPSCHLKLISTDFPTGFHDSVYVLPLYFC